MSQVSLAPGTLARARTLLRDVRSPASATISAALVALVLVAGCSSQAPTNDAGAVIVQPEDDDGWNGTALDTRYVEPALTFTDTDGRSFDLAADTEADATLVFFGYTHCPDVCNAVLADLASALRRIDPGVRDRTEVVFVTTDPERDTAPVIREYLDRFDESFIGLTAPMPVIEEAAETMGVALTGKSAQIGASYEVGHSAHVIGFQADGTAPVLWLPGTPVGDLREDIARLVDAA